MLCQLDEHPIWRESVLVRNEAVHIEIHGIGRQIDYRSFEAIVHDDLAPEAARLGEGGGKVQAVLLVLARVLEALVDRLRQHAMTSRASNRSFACTL